VSSRSVSGEAVDCGESCDETIPFPRPCISHRALTSFSHHHQHYPAHNYSIMAGNIANELASTLQSAHIVSHPDPAYDVNPSTAASKKQPVRFRPNAARRPSSDTLSPSPTRSSEIPLSVLEPPPRRNNLPPLPDLRFEQSYLARIQPFSQPADGGPPNYLMIAWVTLLDQAILPFSQGVIWNLALHGWRAWNVATKFQGQSVGARVRRWWWQTNNWKLPEVRRQEKMAEKVKDFYVNEFGSGMPD